MVSFNWSATNEVAAVIVALAALFYSLGQASVLDLHSVFVALSYSVTAGAGILGITGIQLSSPAQAAPKSP